MEKICPRIQKMILKKNNITDGCEKTRNVLDGETYQLPWTIKRATTN